MTNRTSFQQESEQKHLLAEVSLSIIIASPLILFGLLLTLGHFVHQDFIATGNNENMFAEPLSLRMFEIAYDESAIEDLKALHVWIENSPSMAGFVDNGTDCPESFLPYILRQTDNSINTWFSNTTQFDYHSFNASLAKRIMQADTDEYKGILDGVKIANPASALKRTFYLPNTGIATVLEDAKRYSALAGLLTAIDPGQPHLILTDFQETVTALEGDLLQTASETLFEKNLSIKVVAMDSLFSGALFDAGNTDEIIAFYVENDSAFRTPSNNSKYKNFSVGNHTYTATTVIKTGNGYHAHPRPLYAIVIGTNRQCDLIVTTLTSHYESFRSSLTFKDTDPVGAHKKNSQDSDEDVLRKAEVFSFGQIGVEKVLLKVDDNQIKPSDQDDPTRTTSERDYDQQPLHADGVDAYRFVKDPELASQLYTLHYHFEPSVEGYSSNYEQDTYAPGKVKTYQFIFGTPENSETLTGIVRTIGNNKLCYYMQTIVPSTNTFRLANFTKTAKGIDFDLEIDISALTKGFYRLELPFMLMRSGNSLSLDYRNSQSWNVPDDKVKDSPYNTTNLYTQMESIYNAQKVLINGESLVALVTIDIEVAIKD